MPCETCRHFTPVESLAESGYCDWLKSSHALMTKIPSSIEQLREVGILMTKTGGTACRAYTLNRATVKQSP